MRHIGNGLHHAPIPGGVALVQKQRETHRGQLGKHNLRDGDDQRVAQKAIGIRRVEEGFKVEIPRVRPRAAPDALLHAEIFKGQHDAVHRRI